MSSFFEDGQTWTDVGKRLALATDSELRAEASLLEKKERQLALDLAPFCEEEKTLKRRISEAEEHLDALRSRLALVSKQLVKSGYREESVERSRRLMDEEILRRFYSGLRGT